jgi:hypothetical protein
MPLSFLYYYVAEQWRLVQKKMVAAENIYHGCPRIILAFKLVKNPDLSLWPNAISATTSI